MPVRDDEDDRPRRRRDGDDFDDRPRRPKQKSNMVLWLVLGGVGLLLCLCIAVPIGVGLLLPAVQKVRQAAQTQKGSNNLLQIGLGVHNYHDANGKLPPPFVTAPNAKPLADPQRRLSWRVGVLPYVEQDAMYRRMNLAEAWDSPANKPFSDTPVSVFADPGSPSNQTRYRAFVGRGTLFDPDQAVTFANVTDGLSNTILAVEAADTVPWAQYRELPFDQNASVPPLGRANENTFLVLMGDGSTRVIQKSVNPTTLKAAITRNGGETVFLD
jgi:hypothetical protein